MSRILHRPMFRKGGQANGGITTGLGRQGYTNGGQTGMEKIQRDLAIIDQLSPQRGSGLNDFMINFGLNMVGNPPSGNIFQTAAKQAQQPFQQFQQSRAQGALAQRELIANMVQNMNEDDKYKLQVEAQHMFDNGAVNPFTNKPFASPTEALNALIKNKLMSKERVLTDEAKFENTYNQYLDSILSEKRGDFAKNRLGASALATHEAKIKHNRYPKELVEEFDLETTYIPLGVVDWANVNSDGSFKLTEALGKNAKATNTIKAGKIYFNVSDKLFYRFNGDSFTVIDIAEFK
jgi:hypothetical protein